MRTVLTTLRDIDGVLGSFVIDAEGGLVARDMPGMFDDDTLLAASARLARLRSALSSDADPFEGCTARFGSNLLVLKAAAARTLCVLVPREANLMALQMGTTLVARRVSNMAITPNVTPAATAPLPALSNAAPEAPSVRRFRGQPV